MAKSNLGDWSSLQQETFSDKVGAPFNQERVSAKVLTRCIVRFLSFTGTQKFLDFSNWHAQKT